MRQKCVRHASEMRQNGSCFIGKRGTFQNASEMRQNCVKNASEMRGTPLGENTFRTIPSNHLWADGTPCRSTCLCDVTHCQSRCEASACQLKVIPYTAIYLDDMIDKPGMLQLAADLTVFSKRRFSDSMPRLATEMHPCTGTKTAWKHQAFQAFWCLLPLRILTTLWTQTLKNTV